jgi:hypothetical protein
MKTAIICVASLWTMLAAMPVEAQDQYRAVPFAGSYSDERLTENRWRVGGSVIGNSDLAIATALYRAALTVKKAGYDHFKVVRAEIVDTYRYDRVRVNQRAKFTIVAAHSAELLDAVPCEEKPKRVESCRTLKVEDVIREEGAKLYRKESDWQTDLDAVQLQTPKNRR